MGGKKDKLHKSRNGAAGDSTETSRWLWTLRCWLRIRIEVHKFRELFATRMQRILRSLPAARDCDRSWRRCRPGVFDPFAGEFDGRRRRTHPPCCDRQKIFEGFEVGRGRASHVIVQRSRPVQGMEKRLDVQNAGAGRYLRQKAGKEDPLFSHAGELALQRTGPESPQTPLTRGGIRAWVLVFPLSPGAPTRHNQWERSQPARNGQTRGAFSRKKEPAYFRGRAFRQRPNPLPSLGGVDRRPCIKAGPTATTSSRSFREDSRPENIKGRRGGRTILEQTTCSVSRAAK